MKVDDLVTDMALGMTPVADMTFGFERMIYGRAAERVAMGPPVFVVGLARGGSSIITRRAASASGSRDPVSPQSRL